MESKLVQYELFANRVKDDIRDGNGPFSIAYADIDNLSIIEKQFGKEIADEAVKKVTSILLQNISDMDLIYQINDEYSIFLSGKGSERSLMEMEEIRRHLSDNTYELKVGDIVADVYITLSIGIASYPRDSKNSIELFRIADSAMFRAKKLGKNKVCLSEAESMVLKSSYFTKTQMDRLSALAKETERTEAFLLREAVDELFKKYKR